ncbi:MAG: OadG family transporter subunit [Rikenellaceae bacterium]
MENLDTALTMLAIGMGTVFFILVFIIFFCKLLITLVNKYVPLEEIEKAKATNSPVGSMSPKVVAAISAAINIASAGKMKVAKIEKK